MKPKSTLRKFLAIASSALLSISYAQAQLYWDSNAGTAGFGNTTGTWGTSNFWNDDITGGAGTFSTATTSADNVNFGTATLNYANGTIGVAAGGVTVGGITIGAGQTQAINLGTLGNSVTIHGGITKNNGSGNFTFSSPVILGAAQTWTNNSAGTLSTNINNVGYIITNGGFDLTIDGTGTTSFGNVAGATATLSGSGALVKNGTGRLNIGGVNTGFSGTVTLNGGVTHVNNANEPLGLGNLTLNGGVMSWYWGATYTRTLGIGNSQVQILGGESGFAGSGTSGPGINLGATVMWGTLGEGSGATGFFNPSKFVLGDEGTANVATTVFQSGINLNGTTRIILVPKGLSAGGNNSTISGAITNSTGTAGLTKEGGGNLILSNAGNTYSGATTITEGILQANSTGALGNSSATNTLIFNGGSLRAGGTITSVATRGVTLTSTGTIDNNGQLVSIAGDMTGAGGLTKNGANTLTLSGTNNYGGVTTVNAGTLAIAKEASLASNTAANINVKAGAGLALNVDSAGSAGFTSANLSTLLGNISVANTAAQGMHGGTTLALDTSTATGATFTQGNAITNSTGAFGGVINLTKLGAGTLVFDKANTYTGLTTISAGTLQLSASSVILGPIINNGILLVDKAATVGTDFPANIIGSGSVAVNTGGTVTISSATALQNIALNTTGAGSFILSGVTTPVFGGLSGATGDLATVISNYNTVTALTLNPQSGVSVTYGGIISNGSGTMSLTKTGAGTQILTGANTYTGATMVNGGTLTVGVGGSLDSSSALQMGGNGIFTYSRTGAGQTINGLTVNGGGSVVNNTVSGQTLTLGAITRTASQFGTVNFATLTGPINTSTVNTNGIIAPWATTGSTTTLRYAVGGGNISALTGTTATANTLGNVTDATANYEYSAAVAGMGAGLSLTGNTLRYSGAATTTAINATSSITLNGLMNAGSGLLTISGGPSTGGIIIGSTNELVITANAQATTISAVIADGAAPGALVYAGGGILSLNGKNTFTGGIYLNNSTIAVPNPGAAGGGTGGYYGLNNNNIYASGYSIINNANSTKDASTEIYSGAITLSDGAVLDFRNNTRNFSTSGAVTGNGGITLGQSGGGATNLNFNSTGNNFTGPIRYAVTAQSGNLTVNSLADAASLGAGDITFGLANSGVPHNFTYGASAIAPLTLNNRGFELAGSGTQILSINNNSSQAFTINTDLLSTGTGTKTLTLGGTGAGLNTFAGMISSGSLTSLSLSKAGAGTWVLSNTANTYTGVTNVTAGVLEVKSLANGGSASSIGASSNAAGNLLIGNGATLLYTGSGHSSDRGFTINGTAAGHQATLNASGASGALNLTNTATPGYGTTNQTRTLNLGGANTGTNTLAANLTNNGSGAVSVNKNDAGRWILSGNNTYTGTTSINAGVLEAVHGTSLPSSSILQLRGGVFQSSGTFSRTVGTAAGNVNWSTSSGGFAAIGGTLNLQLNGGTGSVTWNGASMVSDGQTLIFGSTSADNLVDFQNALNLGSSGSGQRTITVNDNTGSETDIARISGAITNTAAGWGIIKNGAGTLQLTNTNTYTGATTVSEGTLALIDGSQTSAITVETGASLGFTIGSPTITSTASLDLTDGTVKITGTPTLPSYTLMTASSITPDPVLASPITGYELVVDGTALKLNSTGPSSPYDTWAASFSLENPWLTVDPLLNGEAGANPDGDGFTNLQEFAFGFDPNVPDGFGPLTISGGVITQNGPPQLYVDPVTFQYFLRYTRRADHATAGITYTAQFAADSLGAGDFENVSGGTVVGTGTGAGGVDIEAVAIEFPDALPVSGKKARFGRVAVSMP